MRQIDRARHYQSPEAARTVLSRRRGLLLSVQPAICEAYFSRGGSSRRGRFLFVGQLTQRALHSILAQRRISIDDLSDTHPVRQAFKQKSDRDARSLHSGLTAEM